MNRTLIFAVAAGVAVMPAVFGLAGNPSFSHRLPVQVPAGAPLVQEVGDSELRVVDAEPTGSESTSGPDSGRGSSGADGQSGSAGSAGSEPGDDKGGAPSRSSTSGADDHGGSGKTAPSTSSGDSHGGGSVGGSSGSKGGSGGSKGGSGGHDGSGHH